MHTTKDGWMPESLRLVFWTTGLLGFTLLVAPAIRGAGLDDQAEDSGAAHRLRRSLFRKVDATIVNVRGIREWGGGRSISEGTGVVISSGGLMVTAYHVVDGFSDIEVVMADGETLAAEVVQTQPELDLAFLAVYPDVPFEYAPLAHPGLVQQGRPVFVYRNPPSTYSFIRGVVGPTQIVHWYGLREHLTAVESPVLEGDSGGGVFDHQSGALVGVIVAQGIGNERRSYMVPATRIRTLLEPEGEPTAARLVQTELR